MEFDFTPDTSYNYSGTIYTFVPTNLVRSNVNDGKAPAPVDYMWLNTKIMMAPCPLVPPVDNRILSPFPKFVSNEYPSELFEDYKGNAIGTPGKTMDITLIASKPSEDTQKKLDDALKQEAGVDVAQDALEYLTYDLGMSCHLARASIKEGQRIRLALPYPKGFDPRTIEGVQFEAYHFIEEPKGSGNYKPEKLVCNATETGLWVMVDSFSPFTIVQRKEAISEINAASKAFTITYDKEKTQSVVISGDDNPSAELVPMDGEKHSERNITVTPKTGYSVEKVIINGEDVTFNYDLSNNFSSVVRFADMKVNTSISVVMKADAVKQLEDELKTQVDFKSAEPTVLSELAPDSAKAAEETLSAVNEIEAIEIKDQPSKLSYIDGDKLNLDGLTITQRYTDGTIKVISSQNFASTSVFTDIADGSALKSTQNGNKITITSGGKTAQTEALTVNEAPVVNSIEIVNQPGKLTYFEQTPLSLAGLRVKLNYSDKSSEIVAFSDFESRAITLSAKDGTALTVAEHNGKAVTISCNGKTVSTNALEVKSRDTIYTLSIMTQPDKLVYVLGERLSLSGLILSVVYEKDKDNPSVKPTLIPASNFLLSGVSADIADGTVLTQEKTGMAITLTFGGKTVKTDAITVASPPQDPFKAVTDIESVPSSATAGTDLTLSGTVVPLDATEHTIVWSIKNAGATGACVVDGKLKTTAAGTVVLTATITNGRTETTNFTKDFNITVNSAPISVYGTVTREDTPIQNVNGASVVLWQGNTEKGSAVTDADGKYSIENVADGLYRITVSSNGKTITDAVAVKGDSIAKDMVFLSGNKDSLLDISPEAPNILVSGLSELLTAPNISEFLNPTEQEAILDGGSVRLKFSAQKISASSVESEKNKIEALAVDKALGLIMDLSVLKTVKNSDASVLTDNKAVSQLAQPIIVYLDIPSELQNAPGFSIYRVHNETAELLSPTLVNDEYYSISPDGKSLTMALNRFSTYALAYTAYDVTVIGGGTGATVKNKYQEGATVEIYAGTKSGYSFNGWTSSDGISFKDKNNASTSFTMPKKPVTITANWRYNGGGSSSSYNYYNIKLAKEGNGSISPNGGSSSIINLVEGSSQTFAFTADKGYVISDVLADGMSVGAVSSYTFSGIAKNHTLKVIFKASENPEKPIEMRFEDVKESDWFYNFVKTAVERGLFSGTSDRYFSPMLPTTRGMIATVLWRMENQPKVSGGSLFEDVDVNAWYYSGIAWAKESAVVDGYGNGMFGPLDNVTREQLASILYRYAKFKGYNTSKTVLLDGFTDKGSVSEYASSAMQWAVGNGIIKGKGNGILDPKGTATRGETAAVLSEFYKLFIADTDIKQS